MTTARATVVRHLVALALALVPALGAAIQAPQAVSPGGARPGSVVEARCPTFSWTAVPEAPGYELAVLRIQKPVAGEESDNQEPVVRVSLPRHAQTWTPPIGQCLERGDHFAWSVAVAKGEDAIESDSELAWSMPFLFAVQAAPSLEELEQAMSTIERYRTQTLGDRPAPAELSRDAPLDPPSRSIEPRLPSAPATAHDLGDEPPSPPAQGIVRAAAAASTPTLGPASLAVASQIHLGAASDLFKDHDVFLWDDTTGNLALGRSALSSVSGTATRNTAVGREALYSATGGAFAFQGSLHTAVGDRALRSNTTGFHNSALGAYALYANTTGGANSASGAFALFSNTTGYRNTAHGADALRNNTEGARNSATGAYALRSNTIGENNTANGSEALRFNTLGSRNTASGTDALRSNVSGGDNAAVGVDALRNNDSGDFNTAMGVYALRANTSGFANTAVGFRALGSSDTGSNNVAIGRSALYANVDGNGNTAIGRLALRNATTGNRNTALGYAAGFDTTGNSNVLINNFGVADESNTLRIGQATGTDPSELNNVFFQGIWGKSVAGSIAVVIDSAGHLGTVTSSRRFKRDIQSLGAFSERLLELEPVAFRFKDHVADDPATPFEFGLIAEEVAEVFPELVVYDEEGRPMSVKYHLLSSLLLGELQKQHRELGAMRARLEALESGSPSIHPKQRRGR